MKKSLIIVILLSVSVCLAVSLFAGKLYIRNIDPVMKTVDQPMQVAFESSQAVFCEVSLQGWAEINKRFCSGQELSRYSEEVENVLGVKSSIIREQTSDAGFNSVSVKGKISEGLSAEIVFQSLLDTKKENGTYLIISIVDTRGPQSMTLSKQNMLKAFHLFAQTPEINQLLIGFREGKLPKSRYRQVINDIFDAIGGKINGGVEEDNYISKTGYVANIDEKLQVGRNEVNLQVAMSFNEMENRTYIYIGSPLVFSDY